MFYTPRRRSGCPPLSHYQGPILGPPWTSAAGGSSAMVRVHAIFVWKIIPPTKNSCQFCKELPIFVQYQATVHKNYEQSPGIQKYFHI
jgi:hypothetical protein